MIRFNTAVVFDTIPIVTKSVELMHRMQLADIPAEYQGPSFNVVSVSEGNDPVLQMLEDFCEFDSRAVKTPYHDLVLSSHLRYESADDVSTDSVYLSPLIFTSLVNLTGPSYKL